MTLLNLSVSPCSLGCGETFFQPPLRQKECRGKALRSGGQSRADGEGDGRSDAQSLMRVNT